MFTLKTKWRVVITIIFEVSMALIGLRLPAWIVNHAVQHDLALLGAILFCAGWIVSTATLAIWMVTPPEVNA